MKIQQGSLVTITYSFKSKEGVLLGTSDYSGPFTFVIGSGDAMEGLEKNLLEASTGDSLSFIIPCAEAYGEVDETLVRTLPRKKIDPHSQLQEGQQVSDDKGVFLPLGRTFWVRSLDSQTVTLDANHPLAGMDLDFSVEILYVGDEKEAKAFANSSSCCGGSCGSSEDSCSSGGYGSSCGCNSSDEGESKGDYSYGGTCSSHNSDSSNGCGCGGKSEKSCCS